MMVININNTSIQQRMLQYPLHHDHMMFLSFFFLLLVSAYFVALCWPFNRLSVTSGRSAIQYINMEYCGRDKVA